MSTSRKAVKAVAALAAKCGLVFDKDSLQLADKQVAVSILYAGGASLSRFLSDTCKLHFIQCEGELLAVLPASDLMALIEIQALYSQFQRKQFAKYKPKDV